MVAARRQQPEALPYLFLTEMWERFGFYIVQGLLILYMTEYFGFSDKESYTILGIFTALAYISPLFGGYLASKTLGYQTAIIYGGFFLVLGYVLLALPFTKLLFYPALATIIVGNGLFKPNISSLLGMQYSADDPRRDSGFTVFYIGINIGAFLAGISSGYIKEWFGWRTSFALASIGLILGLATFFYGIKYVKNTQKGLPRIAPLKLIACCVLAIIGLNFLLQIHSLANWLLPCVGIILIIFLIVLTLQQNPQYRKSLAILNILILSSILFWTLFWQMFYSANLFVERLVDRDYFGFHLSTTVFWGSESVFIMLFGPLFAWTWQTLGDNNKNPSPISKFTLGIFFTGIGFLVLTAGTLFPNNQGLINPYWVFFSYLLITVGELLISPIGLSAVTMLAPANLVGLMMGVWFVATGFGGIFAGMLANMASIPTTMVNVQEKILVYQEAFLNFAYLAFFVAIVLFFVQFATTRLFKS